jgi:hypothetical protein
MSYGQHPFLDTTPCHNFRTQNDATAFDKRRRELLDEWQPDLLFLMDRWDFREPAEHERRMEILLKEVTGLSKYVCIANQVPVLDVPRDNLRALFAWKIDSGRGVTNVYPDTKELNRKLIHSVNKSFQKSFQNLLCIEPDLAFYNLDGTVNYAKNKKFHYINEDHLSDEGVELVKPMIERVILECVLMKN